jgi:hypothetical protein
MVTATESKPEVRIWKPNPGKQTYVLTLSPEEYFEILFGGRRGAAKTETGLAWLLYDYQDGRLRELVLRRNADDLSDWIDRARKMYIPQGAKIIGGHNSPAIIRFPSGAQIRTGHLKDEGAYMKYQGHEYHRVLIEELTHIPLESNYLMVIASCRSTIPELKPQVFATCNPDGPGFSWVKKRWNLEGIPTKPVVTHDIDGHYDRIFVPAGLKDNPYLDKDPQYRNFLNTLPDGIRQAWRDGSWDEPVIEGAYYTKELLKARKEGRIRVVPHDPRLRVHTVWDIGIGKAKSDASAMSIGFWQHDAVSTRIIDFYGNDGFGLEHYIAEIERKAKEKNYIYGTHFMPHDASKHEIATGMTIKQSAEALGLKPIEVIPRLDLASGMFRVRSMFNRIFFNDIPELVPFMDAIRNYRRVWNTNLLKFNETPFEDWSCHGADMLRYAATVESKMTNETPEQRAEREEITGVQLPGRNYSHYSGKKVNREKRAY